MSDPQLQISTTDHAGRTVLVVRGEIDLATAPDLEEQLGSGGTTPIVDLTAVDFIDSTGLRVLIAAHEARGGLPLVVGDGPVTRLLEITGVRDRLAVFGSVADALRHG